MIGMPSSLQEMRPSTRAATTSGYRMCSCVSLPISIFHFVSMAEVNGQDYVLILHVS